MVSTSSPRSSKSADKALILVQLAQAAESFGRTDDPAALKDITRLSTLASLASVSARRIEQVVSDACSRGQSMRERPPAPTAEVVPLRAAPLAPAPASALPTDYFYPPQPCGKSYEDFKASVTYKQAYDEVAFGSKQEGTYRTIGRSTVLRHLAKKKAEAYARYIADCEAQFEYEREQAFGGREGEYYSGEGSEEEVDTSFDPSQFASRYDDESLMFNPRRSMSVEEVWRRIGRPRVDLDELATGIRVEAEHGVGPVKAGRIALDHLREFPDYYTRLLKMEERARKGMAPNPRCPSCGGASHPASGSVLPSGEVVCGPCVRRFWAWAAKHGEKSYRVGPKGKKATYIRFPTGIEKKPERNPKIVSLGPHAYFAAAGLAMNGRRTSRHPRKVTSRKS